MKKFEAIVKRELYLFIYGQILQVDSFLIFKIYFFYFVQLSQKCEGQNKIIHYSIAQK